MVHWNGLGLFKNCTAPISELKSNRTKRLTGLGIALDSSGVGYLYGFLSDCHGLRLDSRVQQMPNFCLSLI